MQLGDLIGTGVYTVYLLEKSFFPQRLGMFVPSVKFFFLADLGNIIAFECGINVFFGISIKKNEKKCLMFLREQLRSRSEEFVEQMLQTHFGYLIQWINEAERKLEKGWSTSLLI